MKIQLVMWSRQSLTNGNVFHLQCLRNSWRGTVHNVHFSFINYFNHLNPSLLTSSEAHHMRAPQTFSLQKAAIKPFCPRKRWLFLTSPLCSATLFIALNFWIYSNLFDFLVISSKSYFNEMCNTKKNQFLLMLVADVSSCSIFGKQRRLFVLKLISLLKVFE